MVSETRVMVGGASASAAARDGMNRITAPRHRVRSQKPDMRRFKVERFMVKRGEG